MIHEISTFTLFLSV